MENKNGEKIKRKVCLKFSRALLYVSLSLILFSNVSFVPYSMLQSGAVGDPLYKISIVKGADSKIGEYSAVCDSALKIMQVVYNSPEFQNEIRALSFRCDAYCGSCDSVSLVDRRISGSVVLERLFINKELKWNIIIDPSLHALGETIRFTNVTTANLDRIKGDMKELSYAYGLAVNLSHEYAHTVGFCHLYCTNVICFGNKLKELNKGKDPDPKWYKEDVTYRVGWAAYYIIMKWKAEGRKII